MDIQLSIHRAPPCCLRAQCRYPTGHTEVPKPPKAQGTNDKCPFLLCPSWAGRAGAEGAEAAQGVQSWRKRGCLHRKGQLTIY